MRRLGAARFLGLSCVLGWGLRLVGFHLFPNLMILWNPGVFALARLPEFAFGMSLAVWLFEDRSRVEKLLRQALPGDRLSSFGNGRWVNADRGCTLCGFDGCRLVCGALVRFGALAGEGAIAVAVFRPAFLQYLSGPSSVDAALAAE